VQLAASLQLCGTIVVVVTVVIVAEVAETVVVVVVVPVLVVDVAVVVWTTHSINSVPGHCRIAALSNTVHNPSIRMCLHSPPVPNLQV
jgi:hypothetical protein